MQLIATCLFGLEAVVSRELKMLGYDDQQVVDGRVVFSSSLSAVCESNIWLRSAERILLKVGDFSAVTFDELFIGTESLPWQEYIPSDGEFPVEVSSINSRLASVPDCQSIIKKAVVEKLKKKYKTDWFEESGSKYKIVAMLLKDKVTLAFDTSGTGLHKRGYRDLMGAAPLKETLAAAMIMISRWKWDRMLIDPMCGSGTIPIEAAMIGLNIAPGLNRRFAAEEWHFIPKEMWIMSREKALSLGQKDRELRIQASDIDEDSVRLTRYHAQRAGLENEIHIQKLPVSEISSRYKYGFIITNPPYGERVGDPRELSALYKEMGRVFSGFDTWSYYILNSNMEFEKFFGRRADKKRKLYNGGLLCNYYQYFGPVPPRDVTENF
ncbi:MAG: class I SAM-dependent RNA methyltransferase [Eubacteriales bacterium]|nr:class I SAM-dependent RNA methyltransferase [Eubacteriales bacterium]